MSMQAPGGDETGFGQFQQELRRMLYRFDCPDPQTLGDYELDVLPGEHRWRIAAHVLGCEECREELHTLREFLASQPAMPESVVERARRVVATLLTAPSGLAYSGLRGAAASATRVFEAGDVSVTVGPGSARGSLVGLVVAGEHPPEALAGRSVRLLPRGGPPLVSTLDDLGNFEFADLLPDQYAIEIDLPDGIIVIQELRVD
jgi:hypothetical protein